MSARSVQASSALPPAPLRNALRFACALGALALCALAIWTCAFVGLSRLVSDYGARTGQRAAADLAVRLAPADPEAHYARAGLLGEAGALTEAQAAYEAAIKLRPADYVLWLELGKLREQAGDTAGALAAFEEAVRRAPYYAEPRWQLGNSYLRAGRTTEAFAELRRAARRDPARYPNLIDLAWYAAGRDPQQLIATVEPDEGAAHLLVAHFLARHGAAQLAVEQFRAAGASATENERRDLVKELLAARSYLAAYALWSAAGSEPHAPGQVTDGGFEQSVRLDEPGFGWQFARDTGDAIKFSLDTAAPRAGARSLRLDFAGNSAPGRELLSQLIIVEPGVRYRLRFAARTSSLVTGGPLLVRVLALSAQGDVSLAQSAPLATGTSDWQDASLEFNTPPDVRAVRLTITRQACMGSQGPCPAFGQVWFDQFVLDRL